MEGRTLTALYFMFCFLGVVAVPAAENGEVSAILKPGNIVGGKERTIVVTAEKQRVFWHHANLAGGKGGVWYEVLVYTDNGNVVVHESDSVAGPSRSRSSTEVLRFTIEKLSSEKIELRHGNRITLSGRTRTQSDGSQPKR